MAPPPARLGVIYRVFGYSEKGRPIDGWEIGTGPDVLLFMGAIHGNEMGTADLLNKFVVELRANPALVPTMKKLVVIPIVNPDGYYDRADNLNADGINLNLNFVTAHLAELRAGRQLRRPGALFGKGKPGHPGRGGEISTAGHAFLPSPRGFDLAGEHRRFCGLGQVVRGEDRI